MTHATIDGVKIFTDFDCQLAEMENYLEYVNARVDEDVSTITVTTCPDGLVDVKWVAHGQKFERIRRITGYLTGDLNSWNNAKQAEEHDRVKHDVGGYDHA